MQSRCQWADSRKSFGINGLLYHHRVMVSNGMDNMVGCYTEICKALVAKGLVDPMGWMDAGPCWHVTCIRLPPANVGTPLAYMGYLAWGVHAWGLGLRPGMYRACRCSGIVIACGILAWHMHTIPASYCITIWECSQCQASGGVVPVPLPCPDDLDPRDLLHACNTNNYNVGYPEGLPSIFCLTKS